MRLGLSIILFIFNNILISNCLPGQTSPHSNAFKTSEDLLISLKTKSNPEQLIEQIKKINIQELISELNTVSERKAFWINIYNSFTQILATKDSIIFTNKSKFFFSTGYIYFWP